MNIEELKHLASEESQQDWNRLEYRDIYRKAFIDGGTAVLESKDGEFDAVCAKLKRLQSSLPKIKADALWWALGTIDPRNEDEDRIMRIIEKCAEKLEAGE